VTSRTVLPEIRTVIVEDESLARQKLERFLESEPGIRVVASVSESSAAVREILANSPDLIFIDIQLPGGNGLSVIEEISASCTPYIVFTTAYDQYAIKAFELHAVDYLLKPFDQSRLHQAVEKVRSRIFSAPLTQWTQQLAQLLERMPAHTVREESRIVVKTGGRVLFLEPEDIEWIEAASNYVRVRCGSNSYMIRNTISDIEEKLDPHHFLRVHRSIIVNVSKIKEVQPCNSGEYVVVMRSGKELSCSRTYRAAIASIVRERL
jgi:two-component system, LytTR family, response regulator